MKPDDLRIVAGKLPLSPSTLARNRTGVEDFLEKVEREKQNPKKRLRQEGKPLLNKLETCAFHYLQQRHIGKIRPQAKRYRLANGIWYKPDFTAVIDGQEIAWEVKGPHVFRGGFENLKFAATAFPEVRWILMWRDNTTGIWSTQIVKS